MRAGDRDEAVGLMASYVGVRPHKAKGRILLVTYSLARMCAEVASGPDSTVDVELLPNARPDEDARNEATFVAAAIGAAIRRDLPGVILLMEQTDLQIIGKGMASLMMIAAATGNVIDLTEDE